MADEETVESPIEAEGEPEGGATEAVEEEQHEEYDAEGGDNEDGEEEEREDGEEEIAEVEQEEFSEPPEPEPEKDVESEPATAEQVDEEEDTQKGGSFEIKSDKSFPSDQSKESIKLKVDIMKESLTETKMRIQKQKLAALGSTISIRRGNMEYIDRQKIPRYMNSYKLESDKPFNAEKVESILKEVLDEALENLTYDLDKVPKQAKWASSAIRAKVKEQEYDRYKIVCLVTIGEKKSQDVYEIVRFLWDVDRDRYAKYVTENIYLFGVAMCFGLYYE